MAVIVKTKTPRALLGVIRDGIDSRTVVSWQYDADGDFTHKSTEWAGQCWFRSVVGDGQLEFYTIPPQSVVLTKHIYAVYHAELTQMLLAFFDTEFEAVVSTAAPEEGDVVDWD